MSIKALDRHLSPLIPILETEGVTEICINQPKEVHVEKHGEFKCHEVEELDDRFLETLAQLIAEYNKKEFPDPLLSGSLPTKERIQFVMNPISEDGKIICAIRRQNCKDIRLEDYETQGSFEYQRTQTIDADKQLRNAHRKGNILEFIHLAILMKKNILISGGTGSGKTTFLNACLKVIPKEERLITIEDVREVNVHHPNAVHLLFYERDEKLSALQIFKASLRLRPDRIFLSELRGKEVWPYLRAANSGHPGTISTIHAESPYAAFKQLVFMMQEAGSTSNEEQLLSYIKSIIHIVIQIKKDKRMTVKITDIYFNDSDISSG